MTDYSYLFLWVRGYSDLFLRVRGYGNFFFFGGGGGGDYGVKVACSCE